MTQAIVFSKDRAAQLDLLLRSLKRLTGILGDTTVIHRYTTNDHRKGYELCQKQHKTVSFQHQHDFQNQTMTALRIGSSDTVVFFCDDDVVVRQWSFAENNHPGYILENNRDVLCVSLRLGENTSYCYPMRSQQGIPIWEPSEPGSNTWLWAREPGDWGYPGSLDGHIFNRNLLRVLLANKVFAGPNEMEEQLNLACRNLWAEYPLMACYRQSIITGVPINLVNDTHQSNRHGETHQQSPEELNIQYLEGKRLNLGTIRPKDLNAAHNELDLVFT